MADLGWDDCKVGVSEKQSGAVNTNSIYLATLFVPISSNRHTFAHYNIVSSA